MSNVTAYFGPGGNSEAFLRAGYSSSLDAPLFVSSLGLNAYEYEAGNGLSAGAGLLTMIGGEAQRCGVKMSYHTPYFISLSGVVPEKRLKSIDYIRESINAARLLGAETIVVHCGSCAKISRDEALYLAKDTLCRALSEIDTYGIKIGIETMGKQNQLGTLDEVIDICMMDTRLVPVVDFGHLNARDCGGVFKSTDDYRAVFDKIGSSLSRGIAEKLHCHFSKIEWTDKGERHHLTFSDTQYGPDFEPLIEAIVSEGLTPTVICESAGTQSDDALLMMNYYKQILM